MWDVNGPTKKGILGEALTHPPGRSNACPDDTHRCPAGKLNISHFFILLLLLVLCCWRSQMLSCMITGMVLTHRDATVEYLILLVKCFTMITWPGMEMSKFTLEKQNEIFNSGISVSVSTSYHTVTA